LKDYSEMFDCSEMKRVENNKINFINKKYLKILSISKTYPGSIVAYMKTICKEPNRYIYLDKEDFEKIEGKEWFNKNDMENLLSANEDIHLNHMLKKNYERSFYFFDLEEKLKFNQVMENIYYIFN